MYTFNYYNRLRTLSPSKYYRPSTFKKMQSNTILLSNKFYDHIAAEAGAYNFKSTIYID